MPPGTRIEDGALRRRDRPMETELTATQREALVRFKSKQGRYWKSCLVALWVNGRDDRAEDGALLRQVRNTLGVDGLAKVKI